MMLRITGSNETLFISLYWRHRNAESDPSEIRFGYTGFWSVLTDELGFNITNRILSLQHI